MILRSERALGTSLIVVRLQIEGQDNAAACAPHLVVRSTSIMPGSYSVSVLSC